MRRILSIVVLTLVLSGSAFAWSNKEHIQLTRIAAMRLLADPSTPPAMKEWLKANTPDLRDMAGERDYFLYQRIGMIPRHAEGLGFWAVMPDMATFTDLPDKKIEPFGVHERLLHYVDLEFFVPDESRRSYSHDLSSKPKLTDIPREMSDPRYQRAGMLPFRVEECYGKLIESLRAGRLADKAGQYPRDDHAVRWAGYLAHYIEDNTQPHHATIDYKSHSYFAEKRGAPNVHSEMEYKMCDDEMNDYMALREEFWPLFERALETVNDPIQTDDRWQATVEVAMISYDALPMIGVAAMHAADQAGTPEKPEGRAGVFDTVKFFHGKGTYLGRDMTVAEMKAHQLAWAVKRVERLWRQAWDEAM